MKMRFTLSFLFAILSMAIYSQNDYKIGYLGSFGIGGTMEISKIVYESDPEESLPGTVYSLGVAYIFKSQFKTNFEINLLYQYQANDRFNKQRSGYFGNRDRSAKFRTNRLLLPIKLNRPCRLFKKKMTFYQGLVTAYNFYSVYQEWFNSDKGPINKRIYTQGTDGAGWDHKFDLYANIGLNFWSKGSWQIGMDYMLPLTKNSFDAGWESNVPRLKENRFHSLWLRFEWFIGRNDPTPLLLHNMRCGQW
ncbi:MAG: hypothetical protein R2825_30900 [Saprospiraceae bacterium]